MGSIAYADITQAPAPLPCAKLQVLKPGLSLQPPLTRLGHGPGLILLTTPEVYDEQVTQRDDAPTAVLKWAEEGYAVFQISAEAFGSSKIEAVFEEAFRAFEQCNACQPKDKVGLVCEPHPFRFIRSNVVNLSNRLLRRDLGHHKTSPRKIPQHRCQRRLCRRRRREKHRRGPVFVSAEACLWTTQAGHFQALQQVQQRIPVPQSERPVVLSRRSGL